MKISKKCLIPAILLMLFCMTGCGKSKEEAYRSIRVMTLDGSATVVRQSIGEIPAYEDMILESGDDVFVDESSSMVLNLDEDKYILLESGTEMTLIAEGNSADSKTTIDLRKGAIVNNITQKLSEDSSYEVNVPNSTMAVRGTVFRVAIDFDEKGDSYAIVTVLDGQVATRLIFPDGTVQSEEEEKLIPMGMQVQIHGDDEISEYIYADLEPVNLERYSIEALEFLKLCLSNGEELSITEEEIQEIIEIVKERIEEEMALLEAENEEESKEEETEEIEEEAGEETAETPEKKSEEVIPEVVPPVVAPPAAEEKESTDSDSTTPVPTYLVTFKNGDTTFCTQTVTAGNTAKEPTLMPTAIGSWDWDFNTSISGNTTIQWVASEQ